MKKRIIMTISIIISITVIAMGWFLAQTISVNMTLKYAMDQYKHENLSLKDTIRHIERTSKTWYNDSRVLLLLGLDEKLETQIRSRNDITMLIVSRGDCVDIVSFPRDTLVEFPNKYGYWRINGAVPYLTGYGATRFIEQMISLRIDNFLVVDISTAREIVRELMNESLNIYIPQTVKNMIKSIHEQIISK